MLREFVVVSAFCLFLRPLNCQLCQDVRTFDFRNATIQIAPQDEGSRQGSQSFALRNGIAFTSNDPDSLKSHDWRVDLLVNRTVHLDSRTWASVIVLEKDHLTGTGTWGYVLAFGCENGVLVRLFQNSSQGVILKHLTGSEIELYEPSWKVGDAHCCPSAHRELVYRWKPNEHRFQSMSSTTEDGFESKPNER
jgi:hypothetical protein